VIAGRIAFRLAATILSEPQNYEIKHPANWWEAAKERFLPDKLKKKYPVKCTVYDIQTSYRASTAHKKGVRSVEKGQLPTT
jgi:hypothetical protein